MKKTKQEMQVTVPAVTESLPVLRKFITEAGERFRFTNHEINAFRISIDEACTNIIKHGYRGKEPGTIIMKVKVKRDRLVVEIIDQGENFDPNKVGKPDIHEYIERSQRGGLGIFIMRKFLDSIEYEATKIGNVMRLVKFRKNSIFFKPFAAIFHACKRKLSSPHPTLSVIF